MKRFLLFLCVALSVVSCSKDEEEQIEEYYGDEEQITLMYFMGTSLYSSFKNNINDVKSAIESGALSSNGRFFYCISSYAGTDITLYELKQSGDECIESEISSYSYKSMDANSLSTIISDVKEHTNFVDNDDKFAMNLIISSHGTGWILTEGHSSISSAGSFSSGNQRYEEWEPTDNSVQTRYLGSSSYKDGFIDIEDLRSELDSTGTKFGFLLFDACFMSSVEALYRLKDCADYIIASPAEVLSYGFPYETALPEMYTNWGLDFNVQGICEAYIDFYNGYSLPCGTIAACVTSELEALATAQKAVTLSTLTSTEIASLQSYEGRDNHIFFDLKQYVNVAGEGDANLDAYNTQYDKTFPVECQLNTGYFYTLIGTSTGQKPITYYSGATTSAPTTASTYYNEWLLEPWAVATTTDPAN